MARRSRKSSGVPISLFSFQDVMMSIMGILVLVTLIMALDLCRSVVTAEVTDDLMIDEKDNVDLAELQRRLEQLESEYKDAVSGLSSLAGLSGDQRGRVQRELDELARLQARVKELESRAVDLAKEVDEDASVKRDRQAILEQIIRAEQRTKRLKSEAEQLGRNARLTYLIQEGLKKTPILIELSGSRIGVGSPRERESSIWLENGSEAGFQLLAGLVSNYAPDDHYMVILVKPSGFASFYKVAELLRGKGLSVGTELIQEDQSVLSDPETTQ